MRKQLVNEADPETSREFILDMVKELLRFSEEEYQTLDVLRIELEEGKTISKPDFRRLLDKYEKLQEEEMHKKRIQWTLDIIKKLHQAKIGNKEMLDIAKDDLEQGRVLGQAEIIYIKENWKILQKAEQEKEQIVGRTVNHQN